MAPKTQPDENLIFLYLCLKNSGYEKIDFNAVGTAANIKAGAARMRFSRLKSTLDGAGAEGGTPSKGTKRKSEDPRTSGGDDEDDDGKATKKKKQAKEELKQVKDKSSNAKEAGSTEVKKEAVSWDELEEGELDEEAIVDGEEGAGSDF